MVSGVNVLTQEMLSKCGENTKFIVKYDYIIQDEIVIPDNCILEFRGGSLRNGSIDFNHCHIKSNRKVFYNIRFSHLKSFNIHHFDIPQDATILLQDIVNSCTNIDLGNNSLNISKVIDVNGHEGEFVLKNGVINALSNYEIYEGENLFPKGMLFYFHNISKGIINNLKINGNGYAQRGFYLYHCNNLSIENCSISNFDGKDKASSWGVWCERCYNISLRGSHINNICAKPVGQVGYAIGSAKGVVFEHTYNSRIENNLIENVQSTKDGDALHIIDIPFINGSPAPTRGDLYKDVDVVISNNVIKGNKSSKRCIKIQAFGVKIIDNFIQKLFANSNNVVSIYGSNVIFCNNNIDSQEYYTIGVGTDYLDLHDVVISNNKINHAIKRDWCSCIYILGSSMKNFTIDSNVVNIFNNHNYFCYLREGVDSCFLSNNKVVGGFHFLHTNYTKDATGVFNLQIIGNYFEGYGDFLNIRDNSRVKTTYRDIKVSDNTFIGWNEDSRLFNVDNVSAIRRNITIVKNTSNRSIEL